MEVIKYLSLVAKVLRFIIGLSRKKESEKAPIKPLETENKG